MKMKYKYLARQSAGLKTTILSGWRAKKKFVICNIFVLFFSALLVFGVAACNQQTTFQQDGGKLAIVATTTIVGDVVAQVGGKLIELNVLLPVGTDPHSFDPAPQDVARIAESDLVFANGAGLEAFLANLIESAGAEDRVVYLSDGMDLRFIEVTDEHGGEGEKHTGANPHTWTDPNNVIVWVESIADKLSEIDPANAKVYTANAQEYISELHDLDSWIREQVALIPEANRKLVTDHMLFGYFADEYGFEQVGALIPGYSTLAEPTAKELAAIEDAIRELGVKAVIVGNTVNPSLAERVADDTGARLIFVYTGSLSEPGGGAGTYIEYMRYNTNAFVEALR
jgi:ABC-type Zn uptake system ZnuABC Zn-binding protein ZnuA